MSSSTRFGVGAVITFLAAFTLTGSVVIVPLGALSLVFHGLERRKETATEGVLWASRLSFLFFAAIVGGAVVVLGAIYVPRLMAVWAGTLLTLGVIYAYMRRRTNGGGIDGAV